jgi:hypothetical protein
MDATNSFPKNIIPLQDLNPLLFCSYGGCDATAPRMYVGQLDMFFSNARFSVKKKKKRKKLF